MKSYSRSILQLLMALAVFSLVGCATTHSIEATKKVMVATDKKIEDTTATIDSKKLVEIPLYQRVPGLWISDRVLPRSAAQRLPAVFDKKFVLRERTPLTISDVADIVRASTGINVIVNGDAVAPTRSTVDSVTSLKALLDSATSRFGMTWQWLDGSIQIQQSVVRTFTIDRPGFEPVVAAPVGGATAAKVTTKDPWSDILDAIRGVAPRARVSVMRSSNTITVADSPVNVALVAEMLAVDASQAGKKITLLWKLVNYTATSTDGAGLGLNYLLSRNGGSINFKTPSSTVGATASSLVLSPLLNAAGASAGNVLAGSNLVLNLLNETGSAVTVRDGVVQIKQKGRNDFGTEQEIFYVSESTPGVASSVSTSASVGLKQSSVKVGLSGAFGATMYNSEKVDLSYDFMVSTLDSLKDVTSAGTTLQSPQTTRQYARGVGSVTQGETWVLTAQTSDASDFERRGGLSLRRGRP